MMRSLLLVSAVTALAAPASAQQTKLPTKLVGTWTRTVKPTDVTREGANEMLVFKGRWKLAITASGKYSWYTPKDPKNADVASSLRASATKLTFAPLAECSAPGIYTYTISGADLKLKLVSDPSCSARRALLIGVWHRAAG